RLEPAHPPWPAGRAVRPPRRIALHRPAATRCRGTRADRPAGAGDRRRAHLGTGCRQPRSLPAAAVRRMPGRRFEPAVRQPRPEPGPAVRPQPVAGRAQPRRAPCGGMTMFLLRLALASLNNRRFTALLTVFAIALSVCLLLAVERVRSETRAGFASTISGTDLIVGARSGSVNLLLYSVFRIGNATNNIRWDSFERFAEHPRVSWAIPISLGDSYRGYRVMGTSDAYFEHYRYGRKQPLQLAEGRAFAKDPFEVVLGAEVAAALQHKLDDQLVLAHGVATVSLIQHDDKPFRVVGILKRTGTPVDRTLHISLAGMEALHVDWQHGMPARGAARVDAEQARQLDLQPQQITAFLLGLNSRIATFALQREINQYRGEPLLAILPGVALQELWSLVGTAEKALFVVSLFVVLTGLIGMLTAI